MYEVFHGAELVYSSVHMDSFNLGNVMEGNIIEIHHCREGRIEQQYEDEYFYLMPGDFCITLRKSMVRFFYDPMRHYQGITIGIREDVARQWFGISDAHLKKTPLRVCTACQFFLYASPENAVGYCILNL